MVEWFRNLSDANKIAIVVPVGIAVIGGLVGLLKWLFARVCVRTWCIAVRGVSEPRKRVDGLREKLLYCGKLEFSGV